MREEGREQYTYQSSSAAKFTALSRYVENKSICDTKSLMIALSISLTSLKNKKKRKEKKKSLMIEKKQSSYSSNYEICYCALYLVTKLSNCVPTEWMN